MNISIKQLIGEEYQQVQSFNDKPMASAPTTSLSVAREARKFEYELIAERIKPYVVDMTKELPDIEPLISINESCVCSRGNISAICGEAKGLKQNAALSVLSVLSIRASLLPRVRWCAFRVVIHKFTHSRIHAFTGGGYPC